MRISTFHGFPRLPKQSRPSSGSFRLGNLPFGTAVLQFIREHAAILLQTCFLCAGLIWGASFSKHADAALLERLDFLFFSSMQCRFHGSVPAVLTASAASSFLFLLACFLLGLSLWGTALIPVVPFFRGFGFGLVSGYLLVTYGLKGVLFQLLVILPGAYLGMMAILYAAKEGSHFSRNLTGHFLHKNEKQLEPIAFSRYFTRFCRFLLLALAAAAIDALTALCFSGMFSF